MNRSQRRRAEKIAGNPPPSAAAAPFYTQAVRHQLAGALGEACAAYTKALALAPNHAEAHFGLGLALQNLGNTVRAIDCYERTVVLDPRHASAFNNLAMLLLRAGRLEEAETCSLKSLEIEPASPMFLGNLGEVLMYRGDMDRAAAALRKALTRDAANALSLANLCFVLREQGEVDEAIAAGRRAVALQPNLLVAQHNLAVALYGNDEVEESLVRLRLALTLEPNKPETHMFLALALLTRGDFAQGLEEYEWRWGLKDYSWILGTGLLAKRRWEGEELRDETLLICAEQGFGDTIQFLRYLPLVVARAKRVILWIQPALKALLRHVEGVQVLGMDEPALGVDLYCPLLSLPRIFKTTPRTVPPVAACLHADPVAVEHWQSRLGRRPFRIGISWQGKSGAGADKGRSIPLAAFAPLAQIPGVRLISLQKNFGTEQLETLPEGMKVETFGDDFDAGSRAFLDTAAVMESLDLVISSDTAVAHLAASLGRPTWMPLNRVADWRWGKDSSRTPWYSSMRLFRQTKADDWEGVFAEIAEALAPRVAEARGGEDASEPPPRGGR